MREVPAGPLHHNSLLDSGRLMKLSKREDPGSGQEGGAGRVIAGPDGLEVTTQGVKILGVDVAFAVAESGLVTPVADPQHLSIFHRARWQAGEKRIDVEEVRTAVFDEDDRGDRGIQK